MVECGAYFFPDRLDGQPRPIQQYHPILLFSNDFLFSSLPTSSYNWGVVIFLIHADNERIIRSSKRAFTAEIVKTEHKGVQDS